MCLPLPEMATFGLAVQSQLAVGSDDRDPGRHCDPDNPGGRFQNNDRPFPCNCTYPTVARRGYFREPCSFTLLAMYVFGECACLQRNP